MTLATCIIALIATLTAAITDTRDGRIPNWLTLPLLLVGPSLSLATHGLAGLLFSFLGMLLCAVVPLLLFARDAMGGGDVKLFAALGGVLGTTFGIEVQFFSFCVVAFLLLARMAWNGRLLRMLKNVLLAGGQLFLPKRYQRPLEPEMLTTMRMGLSIFIATLATVAIRGPFSILP